MNEDSKGLFFGYRRLLVRMDLLLEIQMLEIQIQWSIEPPGMVLQLRTFTLLSNIVDWNTVQRTCQTSGGN